MEVGVRASLGLRVSALPARQSSIPFAFSWAGGAGGLPRECPVCSRHLDRSTHGVTVHVDLRLHRMTSGVICGAVGHII